MDWGAAAIVEEVRLAAGLEAVGRAAVGRAAVGRVAVEERAVVARVAAMQEYKSRCPSWPWSRSSSPRRSCSRE